MCTMSATARCAHEVGVPKHLDRNSADLRHERHHLISAAASVLVFSRGTHIGAERLDHLADTIPACSTSQPRYLSVSLSPMSSHSRHVLARAHVFVAAVRDGSDQALHKVEQAPRLHLLVQLDHAASDEMPYGPPRPRQRRVGRMNEDFEEEGMQWLYVGQEVILLISIGERTFA